MERLLISTHRQRLPTGSIFFEDEKIEYISVNYFNPSAITSMGRIFTWSTTPTDITSSFDLSSNESIIKIAAGGSHYLALTSSGRIYSWGRNVEGQLGVGTTISNNTPEDVTSYLNLIVDEIVMDISAGYQHSSVVTSHGRIFTWGI